jgi:hypothetical protein
MNTFDLPIISFISQFAHVSSILNEYIYVFVSNKLLTIMPIVSLLWWYWFKKNERESNDRQLLSQR